MDPVTQAALGGAVGILVGGPRHRRAGGLAGLVAGLLPDADIFIGSESDPLLAVEYHRHFTHALVFQPVIATVAVLAALCLLRWRVPARALWLPALAGAVSHPLCDLWTSYGTRIWWPFSEIRAAWDLVSVIDPLVTVPLLAGFLVCLARPEKSRPVKLALGWVVGYLVLACCLQGWARLTVSDYLAAEGRRPARLAVKPSFGNIVVWRALWIEEGRVHVAAVRAGVVSEGGSAPLVTEIAEGGQKARDFQRFAHFSDDWLIRHPDHPEVIGDARYAMLPDSLRPLWGIGVGGPPGGHASWETFRERDPAAARRLWAMVLGTLDPG